MKMECPSFVSFLLSKDGGTLEVVAENESHNHEISEEDFNFYHKERKLNPEDRLQVEKLISFQSNKKLVQEEMVQKTGKHIIMKDIHNIAQKMKTKDSLDQVLKDLKEQNDCTTDILESDGTLQGLFVQDKTMKKDYSNFPEILFFDGTYKLVNLNFVCYIFMIEDSNGGSKVVALGLLAREDKESMEWLIKAFKSHNKWRLTRIIMTDKDLVERCVFKEQFPEASMMICRFHVLRTFKREVTTDKMKISAEEMKLAKEFLSKLVYSQTEEDYDLIYKDFCSKVAFPVVQYFNKNWHPIHEEWTFMAAMNDAFMNTTNNRLESFNAKLKSIIKLNSSLAEFFQNFFISLSSLRREKLNLNTCASMKIDTIVYPKGSSEDNYQRLVQPYPFKFVRREIDSLLNTKIIETSPSNFSYLCKGKRFPVNCSSCSCMFFNSMKLPCKHIFSLRNSLKLPLYDPNLVARRWTKSYLCPAEIPETSREAFSLTSKKKKKPKSHQEKYRFANTLLSELATIIAESSGIHFERKIEVVESLISHWKQGHEVSLSMLNSDGDNNGYHDNAPATTNATINGAENVSEYCEPSSAQIANLDEAENAVNVPENPGSTLPGIFLFEDHDYLPTAINDATIDEAEKVSEYHNYAEAPTNFSPGDVRCQAKFVESTSVSGVSEHSLPVENDLEISVVYDYEFTNNWSESSMLSSVYNPGVLLKSALTVEDGCYPQSECKKLRLPKIVKRGRPKGHDKTVIGLKKKPLSGPTRK